MADEAKAKKLAAARKRLKEYQKNNTIKRNINENDEKIPSEKIQTPIDSMESSTHSETNATLSNIDQIIPAPIDNNLNVIFSSKPDNLASSYFDSLPSNPKTNDDYSSNTKTNDDCLYQINALEQNTTELTNENADCALNKNAYSNTENLRQLSSQLNSLVQFETTQDVTVTSSLELRNQELAALLETEQSKTNQLNLQIREYLTRMNQLETEINQLRNDQDVRLNRELGPLQEQLQYHVQTVGILVGEKTELTMALNQSQNISKQKTSECEELQGRLKASRHRVSDLEKEILLLKSAKDHHDKGEQNASIEFEKLRLNYNLLQEEVRELTEECSELKEKLNSKINESLIFSQEIQEKSSQLALMKIKVEQLSNGENIHSQLEILNQQKISLEQQITELTQSITSVGKERDQANQQYQQYVQQLNTQIQNLSETLDEKNAKIEMLSGREQSLVKHIGDIEKHLQQLQDERHHTPVTINQDDDEKKDVLIQNLMREKSELERKIDEENVKQHKLEESIEIKDLEILELKSKVEQLSDQPDAAKLLATIESDKVAASRAVEQNRKLKEQLEELHDGFIKMSNNKLELTEQLQSVQHQNKELTEKLAETTKAIEHLHVVIATKDNQIIDTQNSYTEQEKQILQQNQLIDRLRHYEARSGSSDFLQEELQQTRIQLEQIKSERQTETMENPTEPTDDPFCSLLKEKILKLEESNSELQQQINNSSSSEQYLDKEKAMEQLEDRFKKTIIEVADLTEEKQRLEHLVLQLQSETETIGEYVALYQCQRAMLKEKTLEKDEQLKQLAHDKEELKYKLDELNVLVQKLILEKGRMSSDDPKDIILYPACEIHKQIPVNNSFENNNQNDKTAEKIIELLSEIKTNNLVQPKDSIQNFHPCPWCSGQLITV